MEEQSTQNSQTYPSQNKDEKIIAVVSYFTLIGWIIAVVMNTNEKKTELTNFHIRQSLGLMLTLLAIGILQIILIFIPFIGWYMFLSLFFVYIIIFIFWILGLISAIKCERKPVPWIGNFFQISLKSVIN